MKNWTSEALNTAPDSENQIHGDELAKKYGFRGGLVPGVTIASYLVHPAIEIWGRDWLERGYANCRITSPLYDKEKFTVSTDRLSAHHMNSTLVNSLGLATANAEISLNNNLLSQPKIREDCLVESSFKPPLASLKEWERLKKEGCKAFKFHWGGEDPLLYLKSENLLPKILQPSKDGYANLCFLLGCSNWILAGNAYMNPWIHLQTKSQNFIPVSFGTNLIAEMSINEAYEKKGHEFIDVDVNLFDEKTNACAMNINLLAIFKLRDS